MTQALRALLPGTFVLLVAIGAIRFFEDGVLDVVTGRYALVLYGAGTLLAGIFHRSRVVVGLVALAFLDVATRRGPAGEETLLTLGTFLLVLLAVMVLLRDRGVFSRGGLLQIGLSAAVSYAWFAIFQDPLNAEALTRVELLPPGLVGTAGMPHATLVVGTASLVVAGYGVYRWRGPVERALLWNLILLLLALHPSASLSEAALLLMAGGLVLSVSVLETSYFMAYRDELTGLPARRALVHDLEEIAGTYTLAMVDVDHFKKFNDEHGHDVGDQVLRLVASRLAAGPGGGKAYRYGGEEFTLLYPGRVRDDALPHLEAVRQSIEDAAFSVRSWKRPRKKPVKEKPKRARRAKKLSVTVSIGAADSTGKGATPETVLKKADEALYRAKKAGRNRIAK